MDTKLTFSKGWCKFWLFMASIIQDKAEGTSTKRIVILGAFIVWGKICLASLHPEAVINSDVLTVATITVLGGIGLTIPEWFSKLPKEKAEEKKQDNPEIIK